MRNGLDDEALKQSDDALALAPEAASAEFETSFANIEKAIAEATGETGAERRAELAKRIVGLDA